MWQEAAIKEHALAVEEAVLHRQGRHAFVGGELQALDSAAVGSMGQAEHDEILGAARASLDKRDSIHSQTAEKPGRSILKNNYIRGNDAIPQAASADAISSWSIGWREGRAAVGASIGSRQPQPQQRHGGALPPRARTHSLTRAEAHSLSLPLSGTGVDMQSLRSQKLPGWASRPVLWRVTRPSRLHEWSPLSIFSVLCPDAHFLCQGYTQRGRGCNHLQLASDQPTVENSR